MASLLIQRPDQGTQRVPLGPRPISIGREAANDITINHPFVSRHHACILPRSDGYEVVDTGSTNGTVLNGHRMGGRHRLRPGDHLWLGGVSLIYEAERSEAH